MNQRTQGEAAWIYRKVLGHPLLAAFLEQQEDDGEGPLRVGWGFRASGRAAMKSVKNNGGRLLLMEDAFVRSLRPGNNATVYGLIADSRGIHYDATGLSDLVTALDTGKPTGWMRPDRGNDDIPALMERFRQTGASKYNWFPGEVRDERLPDHEGVLVVDQTRGDAAIIHGGLAAGDFGRMLRDALDASDGAPVYVRAHPDHLYRKKHSCFPADLLTDKRIHLLSPDLSPAQCFSFCHTVLVGSSLMGMEALIHGKKVVTYGRPFFSGRGLTEDRGNFAPRRSVSLAEVFAAAYLRYSHYFDPDSREPCGLGDILDHLALQKEMFRRNRGNSMTVGFSPWNRKIAASYLRSPAGEIVSSNRAPGEADRILVWGRKAGRDLPGVTHVEDGFIRSKGLGAAFNFPYSWVLDSRGIYFDSGGPSDLEEIYNNGFTEAELAEARELAGVLREKRLTKYNLTGVGVSLDPAVVNGRKVILVPGQVEADASIAFGSPEVRSNIELLHRVRAAEPDAFLVFKAHPDLVAGARHGNVLPAGSSHACDLAVTEGNVLDWLDLCDEVHTMTSTVGFEALIREKPVVTYGMPFYAAWGLTTDRLTCPRRTRKLTLNELVCGALMKYPRYLNPATGEFTTALKVTRLLASDTLSGDPRALPLKAVSALKKLWVESARKS
jgi:capsular polysaccharide export protein